MDNLRIIYGRADGGVSIVIPTGDIPIEEVLRRDIPDGAFDPHIVTLDEIPKDRTFRNAWEHKGSKVQVNMERAREIHLARLRKARDKVLAALDIETIKALGKGDKEALAAVEAKKQVLRDLPDTVDLNAATTPEELKAIWPAELSNG